MNKSSVAKPSKSRNGSGKLVAAGARKQKPTARNEKNDTKTWTLRLYVAGQTPRSMSALANLKRLCEKHMPGQYRIEIMDLMKHPELAENDQIVVIPTLIRKLPEPLRRIIGDLSNEERTMVGLDLLPAADGDALP